MEGLFALFLITMLGLAFLMIISQLTVFVYETIRMLLNKNYKRKYNIKGDLIDHNPAGCTYITFWGNVKNIFD